MTVLGIDPGTASIGCAVLDDQNQRSPILRDARTIRIRASSSGERLLKLHTALGDIIRVWRPNAAALERIFFSKNAKTAMAVSEARGVILLTLILAGIRVYEYTPPETKKAVTGDGRADKQQLKKIVRLELKDARRLSLNDDAYDAAALALTCLLQERARLRN
jgi:crossover junction endodeoxyribonuclease RuvC